VRHADIRVLALVLVIAGRGRARTAWLTHPSRKIQATKGRGACTGSNREKRLTHRSLDRNISAIVT
jgi:hypothetical protein